MTSDFNPLKIRERRTALGRSQGWLAAMTGVSAVTISNIEKGRKDPRATTLARIASALGLEMDILFGDAEIRKSAKRRAHSDGR